MKKIFQIFKKIFGLFHFTVSDSGVTIKPKVKEEKVSSLNEESVKVKRKSINLKYLKEAEPDRSTTYRLTISPFDEKLDDAYVIFVNNVDASSRLPIAEMIGDAFAVKSNADAYEFGE